MAMSIPFSFLQSSTQYRNENIGDNKMPSTAPIDLKKEINTAGLKDRNVLITGGASGLGKDMVHWFAGHGANVVLGDVQDEKGAAVEKELSGKAKYVDAF